MKLDKYKTIVFDCDGVVLDSNKVKTQAFYQSSLPYGNSAAEKLRDFHTANGGISRYKKFEYFLDKIVVPGNEGPNIEELLDTYAVEVQRGLIVCEVAEGLKELRESTNANWLIVSGGDQAELRSVFLERGLDALFDGGIFGSPDNKEEILSRELAKKNILQPALFVGDSRYDHVAATKVGLDFIFIDGWTEFLGYKEYCSSHELPIVKSVKELINFT